MAKKDNHDEMDDEGYKKYIDVMESIGLKSDIDKNEIINLQNQIEADIVYSKKSRGYLKFLAIIPVFIVIMLLFLAVLFLSQNNLVKGNVVGASYKIGEYSVVPSSYIVSNKDILKDSEVYVKTSSNPFIGPLLSDYEIVEVAAVKDLIVSVRQEGTKDLRNVPAFDILYVKSLTNSELNKKVEDNTKKANPENPSSLADEIEANGGVRPESVQGGNTESNDLRK